MFRGMSSSRNIIEVATARRTSNPAVTRIIKQKRLEDSYLEKKQHNNRKVKNGPERPDP